MSVYDAAFVDTELSKRTSIYGLRLWVVIGILVGSLIVLTLFLLSLCLTSRNRRTNKNPHTATKLKRHLTPVVSKEIQEIVHLFPHRITIISHHSIDISPATTTQIWDEEEEMKRFREKGKEMNEAFVERKCKTCVKCWQL